MNVFVGLVLMIVMSGCVPQPYVPPSSAAHLKSQLSVWVGKNMSDIPPSWGPPGPPVATADGGKTVTWQNTPRWGCLMTAVADSSGTIRSWELEGASCLGDYTEEEIRQIKAKLIELSAFVHALKRGDHIRLSFYEDAVDTKSERAEATLVCYFVTYSRLVQELTVRTTPEPEHGFIFGKDLYTYELGYIRDIQVLKPGADQPNESPR